MPNFNFKVVNVYNQKETGEIQAANEDIASRALLARGYQIIFLHEKNKKQELQWNPFNRVNLKDLAIFSRQFSIMISASVTVVKSLQIMSTQMENQTFCKAVAKIAEKVDGGARLSESLAMFPNIFTNFYISVIASGEKSGRLDESLVYLAEELEKDYDITSKIKGALIYPIVVVVGMFVVGVLMMIFVVPKLTAVFAETGAQLPLATRILIWTSNMLVNYWWVFLVGAIGLVTSAKILAKRPQIKKVLDELVLKVPVFGNMLKMIYLIRFTRSMNTLITSGVTITEGLRVASNVVDNMVYKKLISDTIIEVEGGNSISSVFMKSKDIPVMVSQMLIVGEKTGKLDVVLERITVFYSRELAQILANLMTLLEPMIMIVMAVAVGGMAAAIILPMYNLASQF